MYKKAENRVKVEGYLAEVDLKNGTFVNRNGETMESVGGTIKILVEQDINGVANNIEVPVHMFSTKYTKTGAINPAYESISKVKDEYVSIAAAGSKEQADKVRITGAEIRMNEFYGQNGQLVSQPRINASFVSRAVGTFEPTASFQLEFVLRKMARAVDSEGVELTPACLKVEAIVPQYTSDKASAMNVDVVPLVVYNDSNIKALEDNWEAGHTYKVNGRLNFTSRTEEVLQQVDFGEAQKIIRTTNVSEIVVTGGELSPKEGDFAFAMDDIKAGMAARDVRLEDQKTRSTAKKAPAQASAANDLGF